MGDGLRQHIEVLEERVRDLKEKVERQDKGQLDSYWNLSDRKRILNKVKSAKKLIADAGFI